MKKLNLLELPKVPGVYRFYNEQSELIYVGKAKNLRRRLSQYQNAKRRKAHAKMRKIFKEATRLDYETCENELLALILETELIQAHRPKWNVVGAFYFLYPMVGVRIHDEQLYLCYTTQPELFPQFDFHGAFRSRTRTREGFFALVELLRIVGHSIKRTQIVKSGLGGPPLKYTYVYGFRQIQGVWMNRLKAFLRGDDFRAIEDLSLLLLERPCALSRSAEIQENLRELRAWWRHEILPLKKARQHSNWTVYPVSQKQRDLLFIKLKNINMGKPVESHFPELTS